MSAEGVSFAGRVLAACYAVALLSAAGADAAVAVGCRNTGPASSIKVPNNFTPIPAGAVVCDRSNSGSLYRYYECVMGPSGASALVGTWTLKTAPAGQVCAPNSNPSLVDTIAPDTGDCQCQNGTPCRQKPNGKSVYCVCSGTPFKGDKCENGPTCPKKGLGNGLDAPAAVGGVRCIDDNTYIIARCVPKGNNAEWAKVDVRSEGKACQAGASGQLDSLIADPCVCQNGGACTAGGTCDCSITGFYGAACQTACTPIPNYQGAITCTDDTNSRVFRDGKCDRKFGLERGESNRHHDKCKPKPCGRNQGRLSNKVDCGCFNGFKGLPSFLNDLWEDKCIDINECLIFNGGCAQTCNNTDGGYTCSCRAGFKLNADGKTCSDINECAPNGGKGPCAQVCKNSVGSFACSCNPGYTLNGDKLTCTANTCTGTISTDATIDVAGCAGKTTGQTCTVSCATGHQSSGDETFTCLASGDFGGSLPTCTPVQCPGLDSQDGKFLVAACEGKTYQQTCTVNCAPGYTDASADYTCGADGVLSGSYPVCAKVKCAGVPAAASAPGASTTCVADSDFGTSCTVACSETGYEGSAATTYVCQADQTWGTADAPFECALVSCPQIAGPDNSASTCSSGQYGDKCTISCQAGFYAAEAKYVCAADKTYTLEDGQTAVAACAPITCDTKPTSAVEGAESDCPASGAWNSACHVFCGDKYTGSSATYVCGDNGEYALQGAALDTCTKKQCSAFSPISGAAGCDAAYDVDATCTTSCGADFYDHSATYTCVLDENKNPVSSLTSGEAFGECTLRTCANLNVATSLDTCAGNIHDPCTLTCDESLYSPGSATYTCSASGAFEADGAALTCTPKPCTATITAPQGASTTCGASTDFGASCTVTCDAAGYQSATATLTCGNAGQYSGSSLDSCATCTGIAHFTGAVTCTSSADSQAGEGSCDQGWSLVQGVGDFCQNELCPANSDFTVPGVPGACTCSGTFYGTLALDANQDWQGQCTACDTIPNGSGSYSCTGAGNTVAGDDFQCNSGFKLDRDSTPNACNAVSCPTTLSEGTCVCNAGSYGSVSWNFAEGSWDVSCTTCQAIAFGSGDVTCTSGADSQAVDGQFACNPGFSLTQGVADTCDFIGCGDHQQQIGYSCSCTLGYFGSPTWDDASSQWTACTACTPIANGQVEPNNQISCTSADDTQGEGNFVCDYGYTFVEGVADSCSEASCPASAIDGTATCSCTPSTQYSTLSFAGGAWSGDCIDCTPILNSNNKVECTSGDDSVRSTDFACDFGFTYVAPDETSTSGRCQDNGCPAFASGHPTACVCDVGYYGTLSAATDAGWTGTCSPCTSIDNGSGAITCTSATDSQVVDEANYCNKGFLLDQSNADDRCAAQTCPAKSAPSGDHDCACIPGTHGSIQWQSGNGYVELEACTDCQAIANAADPNAALTCTDGTKSFAADPITFACAEGYVYVQSSEFGDSCPAVDCSGVVNSNNLQDPDVCVCTAGFYGALTQSSNIFSGTCSPCTAIVYSTGLITCSTADNSVATGCQSGFYYVAPADANSAGHCLVSPAIATLLDESATATIKSALKAEIDAATSSSDSTVEDVSPSTVVTVALVLAAAGVDALRALSYGVSADEGAGTVAFTLNGVTVPLYTDYPLARAFLALDISSVTGSTEEEVTTLLDGATVAAGPTTYGVVTSTPKAVLDAALPGFIFNVLAQCTPSASTEYSAADCTASRYLTGDVCVLSCADGYATGVAQATAEITCQADGSFSAPPQPLCVNIDECATNAYTCGVNEVCQDTPGSYTCACASGYESVDGVCTDVDECAAATSPCLGTCTNSEGSYTCSCDVGTALQADTSCVAAACPDGGAYHPEGEPTTCVCPQGQYITDSLFAWTGAAWTGSCTTCNPIPHSTAGSTVQCSSASDSSPVDVTCNSGFILSGETCAIQVPLASAPTAESFAVYKADIEALTGGEVTQLTPTASIALTEGADSADSILYRFFVASGNGGEAYLESLSTPYAVTAVDNVPIRRRSFDSFTLDISGPYALADFVDQLAHDMSVYIFANPQEGDAFASEDDVKTLVASLMQTGTSAGKTIVSVTGDLAAAQEAVAASATYADGVTLASAVL